MLQRHRMPGALSNEGKVLLQARPTSAQEIFQGGVSGFLPREAHPLPCTQVRYDFIRKTDDKREEPRYNDSKI